jgi:hypothetical protein
VIALSNIDGERVYQSTTVSLDSGPKDGAEARPLIATIKDENVDVEHEVEQKEFLASMTKKLSSQAQKFVKLLVEPNSDFDAWTKKQRIQGVSDPLVRAHLICGFLGVEYEEIQVEIGDIIGPPSVFLVQVRGEDGTREHDVVSARNPKEAVKIVADEYRFGSGREMQRVCGEVYVKRLWRIDERSASALPEGKVLPVS